MGVLSPSGRDADTLEAGKEFGTMFIEERRRGFEITREDIETRRPRLAGRAASRHRTRDGGAHVDWDL